MLPSVLSVLLMGMLPVLGVQTTDSLTLSNLTIASPSPLLAAESPRTFTLQGPFSASGVLVIDFDSGQILFERDARVARPMASLTKLMTALLIVEEHGLDEWVTVPGGIKWMDGTVAYLAEGQQFTVGDLLTAMLVASANDAAETLAVYHSGSSQAFATEMNERAKSLGLKQTSFANPIGLDAEYQWSTPRDIAWLSTFAMRNPEILKRMSMRGARIESRDGTAIYLTHTHAFMHEDSNVIAGKTGTTIGANQCLMSLVQSGDRRYLVVLLNSLQRYRDMRTILNELSPTDVL
ncbi:D-alanyl-D-alanine carboxypeptidase [Candidatus Peregrinibacteria bacterium]|nr:D-alanyl-D-alanine carboxypeptidase [Candidatus Peregrinibacteria bacterium]